MLNRFLTHEANSLLAKTTLSLSPLSRRSLVKTQIFKKLVQYGFGTGRQSGPTSISDKQGIIQRNGNEVTWNFSLMDKYDGKIDCLIIQNNIVINIPWLVKSLKHTDNVVLADGGANIFFESGLGNHDKVRGVIGDLDSLRPSVREFYESYGVSVRKIEDQNKNDFEKTLEWAVSKGWSKIFCFGAFGGRLDHTLATISNAQKLCSKFPEVELVLLGKANVMCHLRGDYTHKIILSSDINRKGCGVITFDKTHGIETEGFKWNVGKQHGFTDLKWGEFISTSNEIVEDSVKIRAEGKDTHLHFVSTFIMGK